MLVPLASPAPTAYTQRERQMKALLMVLLAALLLLLLLFPKRAPGDVAFYLDIGARVLEGQQPYRDYFETNPPVMHYLSILPVGLSRLSGLEVILTANLTTFGLLIVSVWASRAVAVQIWASGNSSPWLAALALAAGTLLILNRAYGQREHLFILLLLPFLLLRIHRWQGGTFNPGLALLLGAMAAVGTSFKPWFVFLTLLPEAYQLLSVRRLRPIVQPEIGGIFLIVAAYGVYALLNLQVVIAYVQDVVPAVTAGYAGFTNKTLAELIFADPSMLGFLVLLGAAWGISSGVPQTARWLRPLTLSALGSFLCYVLQFKGWYYHAVPLYFMALLLLILVLDAMLQLPLFANVLRRYRRVLRVASIALLLLWLGTIGLLLAQTPYGEASAAFHDLIQAHSHAGERVLAADAGIYPNYPAFQQLGLRPVGRYPFAYPLVFAYYLDPPQPLDLVYQTDHQPPPLAQAYVRAFIEDVTSFEPDLIVMQDYICVDCDYQVNTAQYLLARPEAAALLRERYTQVAAQQGVLLYRRIGSP